MALGDKFLFFFPVSSVLLLAECFSYFLWLMGCLSSFLPLARCFFFLSVDGLSVSISSLNVLMVLHGAGMLKYFSLHGFCGADFFCQGILGVLHVWCTCNIYLECT